MTNRERHLTDHERSALRAAAQSLDLPWRIKSAFELRDIRGRLRQVRDILGTAVMRP